MTKIVARHGPQALQGRVRLELFRQTGARLNFLTPVNKAPRNLASLATPDPSPHSLFPGGLR